MKNLTAILYDGGIKSTFAAYTDIIQNKEKSRFLFIYITNKKNDKKEVAILKQAAWLSENSNVEILCHTIRSPLESLTSQLFIRFLKDHLDEELERYYKFNDKRKLIKVIAPSDNIGGMCFNIKNATKFLPVQYTDKDRGQLLSYLLSVAPMDFIKTIIECDNLEGEQHYHPCGYCGRCGRMQSTIISLYRYYMKNGAIWQAEPLKELTAYWYPKLTLRYDAEKEKNRVRNAMNLLAFTHAFSAANGFNFGNF